MSANIPSNALSANWPAEILTDYMMQVQKERDAGYVSDDAASTDSSLFEEEESVSTSFTANSELACPHLAVSDIESDDSAFSSEDEYTDEQLLETQRARRDLVMSRPGPKILGLTVKGLKELHETYMKQLDDADEELSELKGVPFTRITRRAPLLEGYYEMMVAPGAGDEELVRELRKRSAQEIMNSDRETLLSQLIKLAQALFRKEREIKQLQA